LAWFSATRRAISCWSVVFGVGVISQHYNTISQHYNTISQHYNTISQHSNTISQHYNTISQHYNSISQHYNTISQHYNTISQHYNTIRWPGSPLRAVPSLAGLFRSGWGLGCRPLPSEKGTFFFKEFLPYSLGSG